MRTWSKLLLFGAMTLGSISCSSNPAADDARGATVACPVTPMRVVGRFADGQRLDLVELRDGGVILLGKQHPDLPPSPLRMQAPACVTLADVLLLEMLPDGRLWSSLDPQKASFDGKTLSSATGHMTIHTDGSIGGTKKGGMTLSVEDFDPGDECAALLLVTLFFQTMPSQDRADPRTVERDPTSRCK